MRQTLALLLFFIGFSLTSLAQDIRLAHIDPFIGTGGHGHTHPSATAPFGMVQLGPDTRKEGWDGCSGYHYSDSTLYGFSHTHLSGTGVSDYSDILIRPLTGPEDLSETVDFLKFTEKAEAGYYSVQLKNGIECSFTADERVGVHYYSMPDREDHIAYFLLDLRYRDQTLRQGASLSKDAEGSPYVSIHRISKGWANEQSLYASLHVESPLIHISGLTEFEEGRYLLQIEMPRPTTMEAGKEQDIYPSQVMFAVSLSGVDKKGAENNYKAWKDSQAVGDMGWINSFAWTKAKTQLEWQSELNRAQVSGGSEAQKRIYATALYHAFSVPNLWSDADGRYRGMDNAIYQDSEQPHYTVFSLWDTYRTAHPLYLLTQPERALDFIETMLDHYDQTGRLPVWELAANETNCMIAYHSVSVIADAIAKGFLVDIDRALTAMIGTAEADVFGLPTYRDQGYLSLQDESESVSKTLEYAYDDACIAWTADKAGKDSIAEHFWQRSQAWISLLDPETGLARPRDNGAFLKRYEPREVNNNFTEANAWQYSFSPIHDLKRWQEMLSQSGFALESQLDALFDASSQTVGRDQADITGLIGQYAHGNEPSHHIAWLYAATAHPEKGHARVREILETMYSDQNNGYQGNEDCGQMSAWYVMSSWGLYPLVPGEAQYALSAPIWEKVHLPKVGSEGIAFTRRGHGSYLTGWAPNDRVLNSELPSYQTYLSQSELEAHTEHVFFTSTAIPELEKTWSTYANVHRFVDRRDLDLIPAPQINVPRRFEGSTSATITYPFRRNNAQTIPISESRTLNIMSEGMHSSAAHTTKKPNNWSVQVLSGTPNPQYNPGVSALIDGVRGDADWRKGEWFGLQGQDLIVLISPPAAERFKHLDIDLSLLHDQRSWIAYPKRIEMYLIKDNGQEWLAAWSDYDEIQDIPAEIMHWKSDYSQSAPWWNQPKISGIRFEFKNAGVLPDWHLGAGGETFIFIDEISIQE
ncbi:MAG: GH92 family glycosyl hydrolase [Schleiferiaceae bacterium]|nr:GH92 family glycosyl hydrolase [Schleiferiaceae bacterium]